MSLLRSFKYAFCGLWYCIVTQRNMRIHMVFAVYVLIFANYFNMTSIKWIILVVTICSVFCLEMLNTALEKLCDLYSTEFNKNIKHIKDIAAGTVLVAAMGSVAVGIFLFWEPTVWWSIVLHLTGNPILLVLLLFSVILCAMFILFEPRKFKTLIKNK